jgi:hypothetical protein
MISCSEGDSKCNARWSEGGVATPGVVNILFASAGKLNVPLKSLPEEPFVMKRNPINKLVTFYIILSAEVLDISWIHAEFQYILLSNALKLIRDLYRLLTETMD